MIVDSIPYAYTRNGKPFKQNELSNNEFVTTLDSSNNYGRYKFRDDRKDFDGIYAKPIVGYEPESQLWDGLEEKEKAGMTLITKNTKIKKEIKDKTTGKLLPVKGVKFCQYLATVTDERPRDNTYDKKLPDGKTLKLESGNQYCSEPTNEKGETWLQIDEMEYGESYLIEEYTPNQTFIGATNEPIELKQPEEPTKIYVDLGVRFLGETDGESLITYQGLVEQIEGKSLTKRQENGKDTTKIGKFLKPKSNIDNWLKIYDIRKNKVLYIAKKPLTNAVSWNQLCSTGVVFGLDQVNVDGTPQPHFTTPKGCGKVYKSKIITKNNRQYIVRLLKTTKENKPNKNLTHDVNTFKTKTIMGSEWNRYILPLVKDYRYGSRTIGQLEESLKKGGQEGYLEDKNFDIQLADYNWFGDLTLGTNSDTYIYRGNSTNGDEYTGQMSWMQELTDSYTRALRGASNINNGTSYTTGYNSNSPYDDNGFRPVLEEIPQNCYDGACFEGEVAGTDFITYKQLIHEITGKPINEIVDGKSTKGIRQINGVYVEVTLSVKLPEGADKLLSADDRPTGGNWLKIYDYKEGKALYIAKKPLTMAATWNELYKAGVVYGPDVLNIVEENGKLVGKRNPNKLGKIIGENEVKLEGLEYRGKIIKINGKNYIVRLLKAYNTDKNNGDPNTLGNTECKKIQTLGGSEWNRYILPLTRYYRYSYNSNNYLEDTLKLDVSGNKFDVPYKSDYKEYKDAAYEPDGGYKIQLADYNWFGDLTLGTFSSNYPYKYKGNYGNDSGEYGQYSWTQEYTVSTKYRALRGSKYTGDGAANSSMLVSDGGNGEYGFRPVLEEISNN